VTLFDLGQNHKSDFWRGCQVFARLDVVLARSHYAICRMRHIGDDQSIDDSQIPPLQREFSAIASADVLGMAPQVKCGNLKKMLLEDS
jgi:hypothetical protein